MRQIDFSDLSNDHSIKRPFISFNSYTGDIYLSSSFVRQLPKQHNQPYLHFFVDFDRLYIYVSANILGIKLNEVENKNNFIAYRAKNRGAIKRIKESVIIKNQKYLVRKSKIEVGEYTLWEIMLHKKVTKQKA